MRLRNRTTARLTSLLVIAVTIACQPADEAPPADETASSSNAVASLLASDQPVFGVFSGEGSAEQGAMLAANTEADFVFYSLESGPFDIPGLEEYYAGMQQGASDAGIEPQPLLLRIPPIEDGAATADRVQQALDAGVSGIVFPHVTSAEQAQIAVDVMGEELWPVQPSGELVNILIIEDREGIANARDIMATPGLSMVFAGPGDLRRAYDGDMEAVENAIQTVLAACNEFDVPCGVTAGADDIAERLEQGFSVIIVTEPEALAVGREAAGRTAD